VKPGDLDAQGNWVSGEIAFQRAEEMNVMLIREANQRIKQDDTCICVGDFSCRGGEKGVMGLHIKPTEILAKLHGTWIIVGGNHDDNNGVKSACESMVVDIAKYRAWVQHRPLVDEDGYNKKQGHMAAKNPARQMPEWQKSWERRQLEHVRASCDLVICGHVHNAWRTRKIGGIWHVNVGVDVNRYMPINDQEVIVVFERAAREATEGK